MIDTGTVAVTPIALSITSVSDGATISRPDAMIYGTMSNLTGNETGVVVNGIIAVVYGNHFVANHVPLQEGENTITVTATDTDGNTTPTSITINGDTETADDYIRITADTESGASPLETTLTVDGSFSFTESLVTDTGPGTVEYLESGSHKYKVEITGEGIYYFTAEVTDDQSNTYTDQVAVQVIDEAALDAMLKAKWNGMRNALAQNDIDSAVSYFSDYSKESYREMFTVLSDHLAQIEQELGDVQLITVLRNSAEYDISITRNGEDYSFYLFFAKDKDGLWKIRSF